MAYAFRGSCDCHLRASGIDALGAYSRVDTSTVARFVAERGTIMRDELDAQQLSKWVDGRDPETGERRGRELASPASDLILDCTINAPKTFSIAALLHPEIEHAYEALQDRLRNHIIMTWEHELNARRGAGGRNRERLQRLEVVELQHRRSRALDPHIHRHLWLNVRVRGADGKWSNVDSRVAMRVQNLINAEGELAARADPEWVSALAAHGFSLNANGEIEQLAHLVRAVSRRSNQIEANRAMLLEAWRSAHPGDSPSPDVVQSIDRQAWAINRPGKPADVNEDEWSTLTKGELLRLDANVMAIRAPISTRARDRDVLDYDLLARRAVADADNRSQASNGRFSVLDIRAGAVRAVATCGTIGARQDLQNLVDDVTARALAHTRDLIPEVTGKPQHVKSLVTRTFAQLKSELGVRLIWLSNASGTRPSEVPIDAARHAVPDDGRLDPSQRIAANAIAGDDRLVTVTGPAGTGKTTMLRVAKTVLEANKRRLLIVAPTRKAAAVASREVGAAGTSIHALLADHGWRWGKDDASADLWWRLRPGQRDPSNDHRVYRGPRRYPLDATARIAVDEAGMLDLNTADALTQLAIETGAGIVMVGDPNQASPVGHAGAMALAARRAGQAVELAGVHRFEDPEYAALTLRLRSPHTRSEALDAAIELQERQHVLRADDRDAVRAVLAKRYFDHHDRGQSVAIVTATNEEASLINDAIQQERISRQQLNTRRIAIGRDEQRILEGDVVQTRRNDRKIGVENRAIWIVARIGPAVVELQRIDDAADSRTVSREYAAEHVQLAYATTVHGIQGETTDTSIVGPGVDASGLYVGLTRGRHHNEAIVIAHSDEAARNEIADGMMRGLPESDLADAVRAAQDDLHRSARDEIPTQSRPSSVPNTSDELDLRGLTEWIRAARSALLAADAGAADNAARTHCRDSGTERGHHATLDSATRQRLEDRVDEAVALEARYLAGYLPPGTIPQHESTLGLENFAGAVSSQQVGVR
ncbi:AAA family ATPase [Microbacterium sp. A93]|uniref:AAA family ATPase n=1 Tax=Microbacterium sp. A93 TaxID=3450716 RepID=UPI003F42BED0